MEEEKIQIENYKEYKKSQYDICSIAEKLKVI